MAENKKLIVRTSELFNEKNYKIRPFLLDNPLSPSLIEGEENRQVVGIHYHTEDKSVSELNNQSDFNIINDYRNEDISDTSVRYTSVRSTEDKTLEYLPEHHHITELIENIERMQNEYPEKLNMVSYLADKLFDADYAKDMYHLGKGFNITNKVVNGILKSTGTWSGETYTSTWNITGYMTVETADTNIKLNVIIRGIPVPMRKTITSKNGSVYTYVFTYPQYLIDTDESINSIQHIEIQTTDNSAVYWSGKTYLFPIYSNSGDYINLQILNKELRNQ
jgi:hypothetical protein